MAKKKYLTVGSKALYYPYGINKDSIEVIIMRKDITNGIHESHGVPYNIYPTRSGWKDCDRMSFIVDEDGEWVSRDELVAIK